ncbi:Bug family tripartite tricarboxylate transporter substrate binding protein [Cupriavidus necator]|uniref:Bug family tripartite tricarboxylate transporter substrate binding protein n=1 Tax=Cupriavidus necator TaxID=106590 RepID=UPI00278B95E2|nr:tripartite tricarboxylate transporter substrate binding protein [Cupriavidus necator]MDQ0139063.1 tripartite-type tricarboxylate transporter receptor subunit TctC [Cupriavidus necator]
MTDTVPRTSFAAPAALSTDRRRRALLRGLAALGLGAMVGPLYAGNAWPARPIRLVVPAPPGGGTDLFARTLAASLGKALGQTIVVDNKPGATGIIGNDTVAKASPDGYTLLFTYAAAVVINQTLQPKLPYDGLRDLVPVAQIGAGGNFLVVTPDFPARTLREFVEHVRKRPDAFDYGSWGIGSGGHLTMEALRMQTGIKLRHVPYKGVAPILADLQGGVIKAAFVDTSSSLPLIRAGKLRALAVSGTRRAPATPDVPTMTEQGYPFDTDSWYGLFAPAGTSAAIVQRLNAEVNRLLADAPMRERFLQLNMGMAPASSPEQFARTVRADVGAWGKVIEVNHITVD